MLGLFSLSGALVRPSPALAATGTNQTVNFQGRLLTAAGAVVPDGTYNIEFKVYQDGTGTSTGNPGGTLKWTEDWVYSTGGANDKRVIVKNGYFSIALGSTCVFSGGSCQGNTNAGVNWNQDTLWLSMNIGNTSTAATFLAASGDGEMVPMKRFTSAIYALNSNQLGGLTSGQFVQLAQGIQTASVTSNPAIGINATSGSNNLVTLQSSGVDVFDVGSTGNVVLGGNADKFLYVNSPSTNTAGKSLTIEGGLGGTGAASTAGGALVLQGGNANSGTGSANGGDVRIFGGSLGGGGSSGNVTLAYDGTSAIGFVGIRKAASSSYALDISGGLQDVGSATNLPAARIEQAGSTTTGGKGLLVVGGASPGDYTFEVQNSSSATVIAVDTSSNRLIVGNTAGCSGRLCVNQTSTGAGGTATNSYNLQTVTSVSSPSTYISQNVVINDNSTGANSLKGLVVDFTGGSNTAATQNSYYANVKSGSAGTFMQLQNGGTDVFTLTNTGVTTLQNTSNSTAAFQVQTASTGAGVFTVDTSNKGVKVGTSTSGGDLIVGPGFGAHLFSDGFEQANLSPWTSSNGASTVDTAQVRTGKYSYKLVASASQQNVFWATPDNNAGYSPLYARGYYYATANPAADTVLFYISDGGSHQIQVLRQASTGNLGIKYDTTASTFSGTPLALNGWHKLELTGTLATGATGTYKLTYDGTVLFNVSNATAAVATTLKEFQIGSDSNVTQTFWADDIVIDSAAPTVTDSSSLVVSDSGHFGGGLTVGGPAFLQSASTIDEQLFIGKNGSSPSGNSEISLTNSASIYWGQYFNGNADTWRLNANNGDIGANVGMISTGLAFNMATAGTNPAGTTVTGAKTVLKVTASTVEIGQLGTGGLNGKLVLNTTNASNFASTIAASASQAANYDYTLPITTPTAGNCLAATAFSAPAVTLGWTTCGGSSGLAKNATDTSSFAVTASNYLYGFTNSSSAVASGVLSLTNGSNTGTALFVTGTAGTLMDLQNGGSSKLSVTSAGVVTQTASNTTGSSNSITANSLTTGNALKVTSANNSAANTAWSSVLFAVTNSQATTAVSTGTIAGLDVQFTQNAAIAGNTETVANLAVAANSSAVTDNTVSSILNLANNDTSTGNQITATNGININGGNVTNGINFQGTFVTNLISTSTNNFTVTQGGAITAIGTITAPRLTAASGDLNLDSANGRIHLNSSTDITTNANLNIYSGTVSGGISSLSLQSQGTGGIQIGVNSTNKTIDIGAVGTTAGATTVNIANSTGATQALNVGSTQASSTTSINGGNGITLNGNVTVGSGKTFQGAGLSADCDAQNSKLLWDTTTKLFSCGTDRASVTVRKSADQSRTSSTTLLSDSELTFAIAANDVYVFHIMAYFTFATASDFKYAVASPAGATCNLQSVGHDTSGYGWEMQNTACNTTVNYGNSSGTDTVDIENIDGTVINSTTAGNMTFQFAQITSGGTATTVKAGSSLVAFKASGADLAEVYYTDDKTIGPGSVVSLDPSKAAGVVKASKPYDSRVLGVISTNPGQVLADPNSGKTTGRPVMLALAGRIPVRVTTEGGAIRAGDFLTASSVPGLAMKASHSGQVIGKALEDFDGSNGDSQGIVLMFASQQWADPRDPDGDPLQSDTLQAAGETINATSLNMSGSANIGGDLTVNGSVNAKVLTIKGMASVNDLNVTGKARLASLDVAGPTTVADITVDGHVMTHGEAPVVTVIPPTDPSTTVTVDGNDVSGTVTVKAGKLTAPAGDLAKVKFNKPYNKAPHVVLSPRGATTARLQPYLSASTPEDFAIGIMTEGKPEETYEFEYFVTENKDP